MKRIVFLLVLFIAVQSCAQSNRKSKKASAAGSKPAPTTVIKQEPPKVTTSANDVPTELLTNDSTFWSISTLSNVKYVNTTSGPNYGTYTHGGGMLVKFKFLKGNRFEFRLYVQANTYGTMTETWTEFSGTVEFKKDEKGQNIFITNAEKGVYRTSKNGTNTSRAIPDADLKGQHSGKYLWEKTTFADDPNNIYMLTVDLEKYPQADINNPKTIDPTWVSKFHIPAK
jgi:hypothetical protein